MKTPMPFISCKRLQLLGFGISSLVWSCLCLLFTILLFRAVWISSFSSFGVFQEKNFNWVHSSFMSNSQFLIRRDKFLEVPQIVWGLNNQKIAFARACLTARMLNRTLLMPSLSASLFYKEIDLLQPIAFDKIFQFQRFNSLCDGFVQLGQFSAISNNSAVFELQKGSGRKWTKERDLYQLRQCKEDPTDKFEVIRIVGKNPFLWHDHWPVKDYARIFECLVLVDEIADEAMKVVSKIREKGNSIRSKGNDLQSNTHSPSFSTSPSPYVAVHMRIEKDWMIHCKKLEQRSNNSVICSSKEEIMERVAHVTSLGHPTVVYLAVADSLLEDSSILSGWKEGLHPFEKKKLGVWDIYKKYPYLIQSAIDYEVCLRADVFVGNSFSTFSSLIVLERTQRMIKMGLTNNIDARRASYAYNILGESGGPCRWMTDMSDSSFHAISYGSNNISC
eukprot:TRINITY_DN7611_c0_g2_i2.p1 TRINITY_DN7611_c0_g2~~TRINITY_DN7611_c0_g2_i2.p1  ORF type:complete len:447 (-),score=67.37 TRINITY_DN7611_c0_g2_i2:603-1943(-)